MHEQGCNTISMWPAIALYNGRSAAVDSMQRSLSAIFANSARPVHFIGHNTPMVHSALDPSQTALLIVPGIIGEDSPYPQDLDMQAMKKINAFVAQGGSLLGVCAGAAHLSRRVVYNAPWGVTKFRHNPYGLFNGLASGPVHAYASSYEPSNRFSDITISPVIAGTSRAPHDHIHIPYGNGPAFYPANDEQVTVHARYRDLPGQPPAVISKAYGAGTVMLSGIHPEITRTQLEQVNHMLQRPSMDTAIQQLSPEQDRLRDEFLRSLLGELLQSPAGAQNKSGKDDERLLRLSP